MATDLWADLLVSLIMRFPIARHGSSGWAAAGVFAGPLAWLLSLQASYSLVPWVCAHKLQMTHPITLVSLAISISGAYLSWRALSASNQATGSASGGEPYRFLAGVGTLISLLFTLVILFQGSAAFILNGCER